MTSLATLNQPFPILFSFAFQQNRRRPSGAATLTGPGASIDHCWYPKAQELIELIVLNFADVIVIVCYISYSHMWTIGQRHDSRKHSEIPKINANMALVTPIRPSVNKTEVNRLLHDLVCYPIASHKPVPCHYSFMRPILQPEPSIAQP